MREKKAKIERPRHHSASEWRELVAEWKASGQSSEEFAATRKVTEKTLRWWETTFRTGRHDKLAATRPAQAPRMVAVHVEPAQTAGARWELLTAQGHVVRGHEPLDPALLDAMIDALLRPARTR